jgi:hypothetical protein
MSQLEEEIALKKKERDQYQGEYKNDILKSLN